MAFAKRQDARSSNYRQSTRLTRTEVNRDSPRHIGAAAAPTLSHVPTVYRVPNGDEFGARDFYERATAFRALTRDQRKRPRRKTLKGAQRALGPPRGPCPYHTPEARKSALLILLSLIRATSLPGSAPQAPGHAVARDHTLLPSRDGRFVARDSLPCTGGSAIGLSAIGAWRGAVADDEGSLRLVQSRVFRLRRLQWSERLSVRERELVARRPKARPSKCCLMASRSRWRPFSLTRKVWSA
jgi:hypothetical protein